MLKPPTFLSVPAGYASNVYKAKCIRSGMLVCLKSYTLGNLCELNRFQVHVGSFSSLASKYILTLTLALRLASIHRHFG